MKGDWVRLSSLENVWALRVFLMGTVWALYGHCMGTYKKPHEADVSQSVVNKFPDGRVDVAVLA